MSLRSPARARIPGLSNGRLTGRPPPRMKISSRRSPRRPHKLQLRPHLRLRLRLHLRLHPRLHLRPHLRPQRRLSRRRCHHCYRRSCCRSQKSDKRSCRRGFGSRHHLACKGRSTERKGSESKRPAREQARRSASIGTPRSTAAARHSLGHTRSTRHPPAEGESERDKGGRKETRSERERESNLRPRRSSHRP